MEYPSRETLYYESARANSHVQKEDGPKLLLAGEAETINISSLSSAAQTSENPEKTAMTVLNFQERGGWKPGTYSVGNFGSTEPRFRPVVGTVDDTQSKPSPATYWPSADVGHRSAPRWSWASDVARPSAREVAHLRPGIDPTLGGPGCVEEHHPGGDLMEHLRRKQNHRDDATAFGTSAAQRAQTAPGTSSPGPAAYDVADSAMLTYSRGTLARANEARARVGSRLLRSIDGKESAVFCGRAKAAAVRRPTPGPDAYTLPSTIRAGGPDPRAKRAAPFATTGARSALTPPRPPRRRRAPARTARRWPPPPPAQAVAGTLPVVGAPRGAEPARRADGPPI